MAELRQDANGQDCSGEPDGRADGLRQQPAGRAEGVRGTNGPPTSLEDSTTSAQKGEEPSRAFPVPHEIRSLYCACCGEKKRITVRCKGRTCPECRRADFWRLIKGYEGMASTMRMPKLMTLTVPNMVKITKDALIAMTRSFKKLFRRKFYRERIRGGLFALEITNHGNGWHPHLHVLIDADYLAQRKLDADWKQLTGGMVDIRARSPHHALPYTLKYVGKAPDIYRVDRNIGGKRYCSAEERTDREQEYNAALRGIRTVQTFGTLYGHEKPMKPVLTCSNCGGTDWISEWGMQSMILRAQVLEVPPRHLTVDPLLEDDEGQADDGEIDEREA